MILHSPIFSVNYYISSSCRMKYYPTTQDASFDERGIRDEQWIASVMQTYYSDLFNYGARFSTDEEMIKDCIQEIFLDLWQRRHTANEILNPRFYFLRAVKNKILKSLDSARRRHNRDLQLQPDDFFYGCPIEKIIISREISVENSIRLKTILATLSKREKEVVYLKYYQSLDNAQIAELMNLGRQSVYNLLHHSILKLRKCWEHEFMGS